MWARKREQPDDLRPPATLGPYRLESQLGEGGMGVVFRAIREPGGEVVALKVLRRELTNDDTYRRRFSHEARAAAAATHRHLTSVLDAGELDGRIFLAVSFVSGRTLEDRIRTEGPLPIGDAVKLAQEIGAALDALHASGVVHRDVKPSNVMLNEAGEAVLTDFGLAKGRAYTVLTKPGQVMGTLDYLAPELIRGEPATPASDIYGFGCVMYEAVTGGAPFADKGVLQVGLAHLEDAPPEPRRDDAPPAFAWALMRALEKDPEKRPPTGVAYAGLLQVGAGRAGA